MYHQVRFQKLFRFILFRSLHFTFGTFTFRLVLFQQTSGGPTESISQLKFRKIDFQNSNQKCSFEGHFPNCFPTNNDQLRSVVRRFRESFYFNPKPFGKAVVLCKKLIKFYGADIGPNGGKVENLDSQTIEQFIHQSLKASLIFKSELIYATFEIWSDQDRSFCTFLLRLHFLFYFYFQTVCSLLRELRA